MEDELVEGQGFPRHFEQALALMELMLQRAKTQIPALVLRPTLLAADSQTGECERASPLYRLVETILTAPKTQPLRAPNERSPLHLVAVDYVARAAYYLGRRSDTAGRTLHLADAHPTRMTHVLNLLLNACGHVQGKPALGSAFNQRIQQPISEWSRVCAALRSPHVLYDARQASSLLASSGIACPPFQDYADKLVDFVRRKRI
jgi:thioester reductase-like protein